MTSSWSIKVEALQKMAQELNNSAQEHELRIAWQKVHLWTSQRPANIKVAGHVLHAEDDLTVLGVVAVTGIGEAHQLRVGSVPLSEGQAHFQVPADGHAAGTFDAPRVGDGFGR